MADHRMDRDPAEPAPAELVEQDLPRDADDLPPMDFSTFIVSLRTSALMHLGVGSGSGGGDLDLALARQEVDLLRVLERKTQGNLTGDEARLLSQVLFDVRTRYLTVYQKKHHA